MLSTISPPASVTRSSLEEMLESIRRRDDKPKDVPPALPVRPVSKARLPSTRRSLPVNFKPGEAVTSSSSCCTVEKEAKKKRDRVLSKEDEVMKFESDEFGSNKISKVEVVVPVAESPYVSKLENEESDDSDLYAASTPLSSRETTANSGGNVDYVPKKDFHVWCQLSNGQWTAGKNISVSVNDALVMLSDGSIVTVPRGDILPANPSILEGIDDLIELSFLNEPSVLHNLQSRYRDDKFYTKAGRVLVTINSFKEVQHNRKEFASTQKLTDPNVYATAERAYNEMLRDEENQSITISGETGAGKTEVANMAMQYLAARGASNEIEYIFFQINRITEAFGNAKTLKNHNSSRFGKFVEFHYNTDGKICGAKIETILLEKSRVVQLAQGERSYHIFYQLCSGAPYSLKQRLNLKTASEYNYLRESACFTIDDVDDAQKFHMLLKALDVVQIAKEDQENVFAILSAILWLGNITFLITDNENHVEAIEDEAATSASELMGCNVQDLMLTLCTRRIQVGTDSIFQKLTLSQAIDTRDALAKSIYASLFNWIIEKMNMALQIDKQRAWRSISIVDICGFESSQKNNFEQLSRNYANEKLQQHLNRHLFKIEQEEYTQEGIDWIRVDFEDNQECLNLFEQKPYSLFSLLDEESNSSQATYLTLLNKLNHHLSSNPCFKEEKDRRFSLCHYAGKVLYDTSGFLQTVRGTLRSDSIQLLSSCIYELPKLFASKMLTPSESSICPTNTQEQSVGMKLKDQLFELIKKLENTNPHFICCIKPNKEQLPSMFENDLVLRQLRSCGVFNIIRISRLGYPTRMTHQNFARRYGLLKLEDVVSQEPLNMSIAILRQFNIHGYRVGYTKFFFQSGQITILEEERKRMLHCIVKVQRCFRGHIVRRHFSELTKSLHGRQSSDLAREASYGREQAVILLQSVIRGWLVRKNSHSMGHLPKSNPYIPTGYNQPNGSSPEQKVPTSGSHHHTMDLARETSYGREQAVIFLQSVIRGWLFRKNSHSMGHVPKSNPYSPTGYNQPNGSSPEQKDQAKVLSVVEEELQREVRKTKAVLKQKQDENAVLQQQLKQIQIRWVEYDARMKGMEETWQKQMTSLQVNLAAAKNNLVVNEATCRNENPDPSPFPPYSDSEDTMSGPRTPELRTPSRLPNRMSSVTPGREPIGDLNAVSHLVKELEQQKQVFNNDVKILVEVKSSQSASTKYSYEDLRKVKNNFEAWKKEFKEKLHETKKTLKRGQESDKARKSWWGKRTTRKT